MFRILKGRQEQNHAFLVLLARRKLILVHAMRNLRGPLFVRAVWRYGYHVTIVSSGSDEAKKLRNLLVS